MEKKEKRKFNESSIISASEINQFCYCSIAWYLKKCGYEPKSKILDDGIKKHIRYGDSIDHVQSKMKKSLILELIGYLLLSIIIILIIFKVIL
jgi:hypothetical protein